MNVDQIQKINALALDLLRQGLASDREDAVNQAERIYEHRYGDSATQMRQTQQAVNSEGHPRPSASSSSYSSSAVTNDPELPPEKVKEILEKNTNFLVKTIKEFQERMLAMEKEVSSMRQGMANARVDRMSQSGTPPPLGEIHTTNNIQRGKTEAPTAENHPRTGNFKQAEVSIEKIFYMGPK